MNFGVFIPILGMMIPIVAILAGMMNKWIKLKEKELEVAASRAADMAAQSVRSQAELEQRVRVLERIVTDRGMDLSDEIERLRDASSLPDRPMN